MRAPDQQGAAAKAWLLDLKQFPPAPALLSAWMVRGEPPPPDADLHPATKCGFHPAWDTWLIQVCHLREVEGLDPPELLYPEAGYEVIIAACDPEQGHVDPDGIHAAGGLRPLQPFDLVKQFHGCSDQQAARMVGLMVREICSGRMSPDSDYRVAWERMIDTTTSHYRDGFHRSS